VFFKSTVGDENYAKIRSMGQKTGFGLLEIVIAASIISAVIFSLSFVFLISQKLETTSSNKIRANFLAEEGLEASRFLRDKSWSTNLAALSAGTNYYLAFATTTSTWSIGAAGPDKVDNLFYRKVTTENVSRDSNDNIVSSGGTNDPDTKKINMEVAWRERGATTTVTISTYLSDIFDN